MTLRVQLEESLASTVPSIFSSRMPEADRVGALAHSGRGLEAVDAQVGSFVFILEDARDDIHAAAIQHGLRRHPEIDATVIQLPDAGPNGGVRPGLRTLRASWRARLALRDHLRQQSAAAIFIHTQAAALLAAPVMMSIPTIISVDATPRNYDAISPHGRRWRRWNPLALPADLMNGRAYTHARALVTSSHWAADSLIRDYRVKPENVHVVRPGVDLTVFRPRQGAREPGPIRVLFVGADFLKKGGLDLLAAMGRLGERAELDIVCASAVGPLQPGLRWRVHAGVPPQSAELAELYRRADIFALPSRSESFGTAVAQAIASGLPVVGCPTGAISEMVIDGLNGFLVPPSDPLRLGRVIEVLIDNPELRHTMGRKSLELAQKEHDAARNVDALFAVLRSVARTARE